MTFFGNVITKSKTFWQLVFLTTKEIMNYSLQFCARIILLNYLATNLFAVPNQILLKNVFVVARMLIALYWKSEYVPDKKRFCKVWHVLLLMNKLTAISKFRLGNLEALQNFCKTWIKCIDYLKSDDSDKDIISQILIL